MGNNVQVFSNNEFGEVRTIEDSKAVWFCAADVAKMLGYADTAKAVKTHCKSDGWANYPVIDSMGRTQEARFLTEGNVWRLIVHSKLPKAQEVERWIMDEVLPAIRHTGSYSKPTVKQPYKYIPKTWRNVPVLTVEDISEATGVPRNKIARVLKISKRFVAGDDFHLLSGNSLAEYKLENPCVERLMSVLYVITASGIHKLAALFGVAVELPLLEAPKQPVEQKPRLPWDDPVEKPVPTVSNDRQETIHDIIDMRKATNAYNALIDVYEVIQEDKKMANTIKKSMQLVSCLITARTLDFLHS
ncbi:MAG: hypothetical protein HFE63_03395 [Clostridiales bacterium]|nr:hypothetical protein [Clostridiales bacterium]